MHPFAERLAEAFTRDFASADRDITWLKVEDERLLWLSPNTVIVGKVDAIGVNGAGEPFFGEWKTLSKYKARTMQDVKDNWRMAPQALTYGVLVPEVKTFTVRWAIKTEPITTDFEWYTYTQEEIEFWKRQLLMVADKIRVMRKLGTPWNTNLNACLRYGKNYACPFMDGCYKLDFVKVPDGMALRTVSHLDIENEFKSTNQNPDVVVLDATRVGTWFECEEKYRKLWEGDGLQESSEALVIGGDFHTIIGEHIAKFIKPGRKEVLPLSTSGNNQEQSCRGLVQVSM